MLSLNGLAPATSHHKHMGSACGSEGLFKRIQIHYISLAWLLLKVL